MQEYFDEMGAALGLNTEGVVKETEQGAWPEPNDAMFYGLAGNMVREIDPHTEADPVAILVQFLAAFGNIVGKSAFYEVEADRHYPNIFATLIGETAKGRKGTSWGQASRLFHMIDPEWSERIQSGLSSGEGLLWAVRDPQSGDEGVQDKRLLGMEPEFASVLRVAGREGNTLSPLLRQAWDSGTLSTLTKNSPLKATNAHITLIAHVTKEELLRYLTSTETGNGFANRFLWLCVKRSKCLPRGGNIQSVNFEPFLEELSAAIDFSKKAGRIEPTEEAWSIWCEVYPGLSEGKPGLLGAVTSRAEAQVMRLAMIYALTDKSCNIESQHLEAALALWDYCDDSARYVFGDAFGNPVADEILNVLKNNPDGLTRTEIYGHFGRHKKSHELSQALNLLLKMGLATKEQIKTDGRSTERWLLREHVNRVVL